MKINVVKNIVENKLSLRFYEDSIHIYNEEIFLIAGQGEEKVLVQFSPRKNQSRNHLSRNKNEIEVTDEIYSVEMSPLTHENADRIREMFPNLCPKPLGLNPVIGLGDRLGIATPGHVKAVGDNPINPIFAQQSIREMNRIERTPQDVIDDAFWGVFISGWQKDWGADADHLKDKESIKACIDSGFTMFTIDIGDYVENNAYSFPLLKVKNKMREFPWQKIKCSQTEFINRYVDKKIFHKDQIIFQIGEEQLFRSFLKYGYAIVQAIDLYRFIEKKIGSKLFDFEVSIDETDIPTTPLEHYLIVNELNRMDVRITSIAPRFVGKFEKGVDYIGDVEDFRTELKKHFQIMSILGPYKISLHSGSDKFRIYPIAADILGRYFHLKTAGTSYLEALKVIAEFDPELFKEISNFCLLNYQNDRESYYVSAKIDKFPDYDKIKIEDIDELFKNFHFRQIMHVTYGSVLTARNMDHSYKFRTLMYKILREHEDRYFTHLESHINRHIRPFISANAKLH